MTERTTESEMLEEDEHVLEDAELVEISIEADQRLESEMEDDEPTELAAPATSHPSLLERCEVRRRELAEALDQLDDDGAPQTRRDIAAAVDAIDGLLTGNRDQIPHVVAARMSRWLESSRYLGAKETRELA
jgi:hypothetical protein